MMKVRSTHYLLVCGIAFALTASVGMAAGQSPAPKQVETATIEQSRGVDPSVDYTRLVRFGPWDDRNYDLTAADIALLPANDRAVRGVPAFFKVLKRKEMAAEGFPIERYYPREIDKEFQMRFGGLMQNGQLHRSGLGIYSHPDPQNPPKPLIYATDPLPHAVPVEGEGPMAVGNNETGIEFNPVNPDIVIAGSNGPGGQDMNYSTDGGVTWFHGGSLPQSCCDPASDWSSDGTVAYTATLAGSSSWRTVVHRSTNGGQNWAPGYVVSSGSSDKEYIHVDKSPTSPYQDNVYATWHQGNTMFFARSTDRAVTFQTPISFPSAAHGIGSDITTDASGRIYYAWPSTDNHPSSAIWVVTSTDGGTSFTPPVQAYDLHGEFDFAIPSMESRNAFIYVSADVDQSGGANNGRVYLAFTDEAPNSPGNGGGSAANSHGWVQVIYSDDQGATWQVAATPHSTTDQATVDRYHPWLDVDSNGIVHIGFYDTRNSTNRTGVDFYYAYSADGGTTWMDETRVSQTVSQNISNGQEWGDYNGLSVSMANVVAMTWTDNRIPSGGGSPVQKSYVGRVTNVVGGPSYVLALDGADDLSVCAGDPVDPVAFTARALGGFNSQVALSFPGLDGAVFPSATAAPNPLTPADPAASGTISLTTAASAASGTYNVTMSGTNGGADPVVRSASFNVEVAAGTPAAATLTSPANGATGVDLQPTLTWSAVANAQSYLVEVSDSNSFANIIESATVSGTSHTLATGLGTSTTYYWRVRADNACASGPVSAVSSFTTGVRMCSTPGVAIPDSSPTGVSNSIVVSDPALLSSLKVEIRSTHTWVGDLTFTLTKGASSAVVIDRPGAPASANGCSGNDIDVVLDDAAATLVEAQCDAAAPTISGTRKPNNAINAAFAGQALAGTWTLKAVDSAGGDVGTIDEWCLVPTTGGGPTYTVGGTVSGLVGSGLVLSLNAGAQSLPLVADGVFTFTTPLADAAPYAVTVATQPGTPAQTCAVNNGNGTIAGADVTHVAVVCTTDVDDTIFEDGFETIVP